MSTKGFKGIDPSIAQDILTPAWMVFSVFGTLLALCGMVFIVFKFGPVGVVLIIGCITAISGAIIAIVMSLRARYERIEMVEQGLRKAIHGSKY